MIKLCDDDIVVSVTILNAQDTVVEPEASKMPVQLWLEDNKSELEKEVQAQFAAASAAPDSVEIDRKLEFFELARSIKRLGESKFEALSEDLHAPYVLRAEEDKRRFDIEKKAFQLLVLDEVLVGSKNGQVSRIKVHSIPFSKGINRGRPLVKIPSDDNLCVVTLITTAEVEADDDDQNASTQAPISTTGMDVLMEQDDDGELAPPIRWKSPAVLAAEVAAKAAALENPNEDHPISRTPTSADKVPVRRVLGKTSSCPTPQAGKLSPLARTISRLSPMARKSSGGSSSSLAAGGKSPGPSVKQTIQKPKAGAKAAAVRGQGGASAAPKKGGRGQKTGK